MWLELPSLMSEERQKKKTKRFTENLYFQNLEKDGGLASHRWVWSQQKRAETGPFREKTERQELLEEQGNPWKEWITGDQ